MIYDLSNYLIYIFMNNNTERGSDDRGKQFNSIEDLWQ